MEIFPVDLENMFEPLDEQKDVAHEESKKLTAEFSALDSTTLKELDDDIVEPEEEDSVFPSPTDTPSVNEKTDPEIIPDSQPQVEEPREDEEQQVQEQEQDPEYKEHEDVPSSTEMQINKLGLYIPLSKFNAEDLRNPLMETAKQTAIRMLLNTMETLAVKRKVEETMNGYIESEAVLKKRMVDIEESSEDKIDKLRQEITETNNALVDATKQNRKMKEMFRDQRNKAITQMHSVITQFKDDTSKFDE